MLLNLKEKLCSYLESSGEQKENHEFLIDLRSVIQNNINYQIHYQKSEVEDLTQECFMKIISLDLSKVENIQGFVNTVTKNSIYDFFRSAKNRNSTVGLEKVDVPFSFDDESDNEKKEILELLKEVIDSMTKKCQSLLDLHQYKSISDKEISKHIGIISSQIPQNRQRCLTKLKKYLETDKQSLLEDLKTLI
jgi:RNA polymerase sigma factor (sigma-70 family)